MLTRSVMAKVRIFFKELILFQFLQQVDDGQPGHSNHTNQSGNMEITNIK